MSRPPQPHPCIPKVAPVPADAERVLAGTRVVAPDDAGEKPFPSSMRLESPTGQTLMPPFQARQVCELMQAAYAFRAHSLAMTKRDDALVAMAKGFAATVKELSKRVNDLESRASRAEGRLVRSNEDLWAERAKRKRLEVLYEHDLRRKFDVVTCPEVFEPTHPIKCPEPDPSGQADLWRCATYSKVALESIGLAHRRSDDGKDDGSDVSI